MSEINPDIYLKVFDHAPLGLAISDETGAVVTANDTLLRIGGYGRDDLVGKSAADFYYDGPGYRDKVLAMVQANRGVLDRHELRFKRKDGSFFWALMSLRPASADGKRYMIAMIEDVHEMKHAEDENLRHTKELERMTQMMVGREMKMVDLKKRVQELESQLAAKKKK